MIDGLSSALYPSFSSIEVIVFIEQGSEFMHYSRRSSSKLHSEPAKY